MELGELLIEKNGNRERVKTREREERKSLAWEEESKGAYLVGFGDGWAVRVEAGEGSSSDRGEGILG